MCSVLYYTPSVQGLSLRGGRSAQCARAVGNATAATVVDASRRTCLRPSSLHKRKLLLAAGVVLAAAVGAGVASDAGSADTS